MKKLVPQANSLDLVIDTFSYIFLHPGCGKQDLVDYCGITLRQVNYYVSACVYLDLLDEHWQPTLLAKDIFENNRAEITERVYERIISDELMGRVYARMELLPNSDILSYAKQLTMTYYPGYSEEVYARRSGNIVKWCDRIIQYVTKNNNICQASQNFKSKR